MLTELENLGIPVGSSSSVQGDAPKFFLSEDHSGLWHPSGLLSEFQIKKEWIVKFPRSSKEKDRLVLQMEEVYYRIAKKFGLNTFEPLFWHDDTLFIPRFDVCFVKSKMKRFGLESLASGIGIAEFGARPNHEKYLEAIAKFSTDPANDLKEYLLRDILNVALGNTDNHPRNTAFLKTPQSCRLSPLFDFAPMWMDTEGITRVCRWADDREVAAQPNWHNIRYYLSEAYEQLKIDWELFFSEKKAQLIELKNDLHNFDMDIGLADYCHENIELQIQELQRALK